MSIENVDRFFEMADADGELRAKLLQAKGGERPSERAVRLAAERGLEFTLEEFERRVEEFLTPDGELSDAQLDGVAGGWGVLLATFQTVSNIQKTRDDASKDAIRNMN